MALQGSITTLMILGWFATGADAQPGDDAAFVATVSSAGHASIMSYVRKEEVPDEAELPVLHEVSLHDKGAGLRHSHTHRHVHNVDGRLYRRAGTSTSAAALTTVLRGALLQAPSLDQATREDSGHPETYIQGDTSVEKVGAEDGDKQLIEEPGSKPSGGKEALGQSANLLSNSRDSRAKLANFVEQVADEGIHCDAAEFDENDCPATYECVKGVCTDVDTNFANKDQQEDEATQALRTNRDAERQTLLDAKNTAFEVHAEAERLKILADAALKAAKQASVQAASDEAEKQTTATQAEESEADKAGVLTDKNNDYNIFIEPLLEA